MLGSPLNLSATPVEYRSGAPQLGAHTREVLETLLGMNESAIEALHRTPEVND
jgi:crotonobetainyl-CoA:carnitine CoA-transferase CaiB-like acyl-CoA transferase